MVDRTLYHEGKTLEALMTKRGSDPVIYNLWEDILCLKEIIKQQLTKREHFAGLAMQGLITLKGSECQDTEITARQCVRMADALLIALKEK